MKKTYLLTAIFIAACSSLLCTQKAFAGAWTVPKEHLFMEFFSKYVFANDKYDNHFEREPLGWDRVNGMDKAAEWWAYDFEWKAEYGLANWLNALFGISYEWATYKEHARPTSWGPYTKKGDGFKYIEVGIKARAVQQPLIVSYQIKGRFAADGFKKLEPTLNKNDDSVEFRVLVGKSYKLGRMPAYVGFESGYRWRQFDEIANDIPIFAEAGVVLFDWLMATVEIDTWLSADYTGEEREDVGTVRAGLIWSPTGKFNQFRKSSNHFNVQLQGGCVIFGRNTNASWEVILKVSTQFDLPAFVDGITTSEHPNTKEVISPTEAVLLEKENRKKDTIDISQ